LEQLGITMTPGIAVSVSIRLRVLQECIGGSGEKMEVSELEA
jgi:hypothetical protein